MDDQSSFRVVLAVIDNDTGKEIAECRTQTDSGDYMSFIETVDHIAIELSNEHSAVSFVAKVTGLSHIDAVTVTIALLARDRTLDPTT